MLSRLDPRLATLVRRLPLALGGALLLWYALLRTTYGEGVVAASEAALRLAERPAVTFLDLDNGLVVVRRADLHSRSDLPAFALSPITSNLVLFLTLLLATPRGLRATGPVRVLSAFAALFATHAVHLALAVQTVYATNLGAFSEATYARWEREVVATGRYFLDIVGKYAFPFVFWALTLSAGADAGTTKAQQGKKPRRRAR